MKQPGLTAGETIPGGEALPVPLGILEAVRTKFLREIAQGAAG